MYIRSIILIERRRRVENKMKMRSIIIILLFSVLTLSPCLCDETRDESLYTTTIELHDIQLQREELSNNDSSIVTLTQLSINNPENASLTRNLSIDYTRHKFMKMNHTASFAVNLKEFISIFSPPYHLDSDLRFFGLTSGMIDMFKLPKEGSSFVETRLQYKHHTTVTIPSKSRCDISLKAKKMNGTLPYLALYRIHSPASVRAAHELTRLGIRDVREGGNGFHTFDRQGVLSFQSMTTIQVDIKISSLES